jgi:hypothetical protein
MSMNRRGFLGVMLGAGMAPAIVKAENLMKIFVPKQEIIELPDYMSVLSGGFNRGELTQQGGFVKKFYMRPTNFEYWAAVTGMVGGLNTAQAEKFRRENGDKLDMFLRAQLAERKRAKDHILSVGKPYEIRQHS